MNICKSNPYDDFKVEKGRNLKTPTFLTEDEVQKIIDYAPTNEKLEKVRDLFIFQCFTGMAYIDLSRFNKDNIQIIDGHKVVKGKRAKTDVEFVSLLLPQAEAVLEKYNYQLPRISNQKYNDYLKLIQVGAGINKGITSHVARHTFATYLLNRNVPIEAVSKAVGHTNIKQTQHYARMLNKTVVNAMLPLLDVNNK